MAVNEAKNRDGLADTFAMLTWGIIVGGAVELLAGLSFAQSFQSRLFSIPVNLLTARLYGLYRDRIINIGTRHIGCSFAQMALLDAFAFMTFQIPLYSSVLLATGAGFEQIIHACVGQVGAMLIMGRPYGVYMQLCRNWFAPKSVPAPIA